MFLVLNCKYAVKKMKRATHTSSGLHVEFNMNLSLLQEQHDKKVLPGVSSAFDFICSINYNVKSE